MVLELILPDLWAIDVLQVNALASLVAVAIWIVEELICKLTQMLEVMLDSEGNVLFCREIARILD